MAVLAPSRLKPGIDLDAGLAAGGLAVVAAFAVAAALVAAGAILPGEDASILFAYAANLGDTGVISFYRGGPPAEGATDFLGMVVLAGLHRLGIAPEIGAALLSAVGGVIVLATLYELVRHELESQGAWRRAATGLLLAATLVGTSFLFPALRGFLTYFFLAPIALMALFFLRDRCGLFFAAALWTCLARPDGFVFAAPLTAVLLWRHRGDAKTWLRFAGLLLAPGIAYFLWRADYFGEWLPLPFYVKAEGSRDVLGLLYSESIRGNLYAMVHAVTLVAAVLAVTTPPRRLLAFIAEHAGLLLTIAVGLAFYAAIRQEQNEGFRFQAPFYLLTLVLFLRLPAKPGSRLRLLLVAGLAALPTIYDTFRDTRREARDDNITPLAAALHAMPRGTMLVTEAGRLPYRSGWIAVDSWGLNTAELARRVILPEDVARYRPDLIVVHSHDPVTAIAARAFQRSNDRSWETHARNILLGAGRDYETYFVPFYKLGSPMYQRYRRHDVYLVRKDSGLADDLRALIRRHDGVPPDALPRRFRLSVG